MFDWDENEINTNNNVIEHLDEQNTGNLNTNFVNLQNTN